MTLRTDSSSLLATAADWTVSHRTPSDRRFSLACLPAALWFVLAVLAGEQIAAAGHADLKNGLTIDGTPVWVQALSGESNRRPRSAKAKHPILMVEDGYRRVFVSQRMVDDIDLTVDVGLYETFRIRQRRTGRLMLDSVGKSVDVSPFDEHGHRTIKILTQYGEKALVQGVTEITPSYLKVLGLNEDRVLGVATSSVPPGELDKMIRNVIDEKNPNDRAAVARFYLQAGMYKQAGDEIESILRDFPELKDRMEPAAVELKQLQAKQLLIELRNRKRAGQHRLAYQAAQILPMDDMGPDVRQEARSLVEEYENARAQGEKALFLLGQLQAELGDTEPVSKVAPLRSLVAEQLDFETLPRLEAFLQLADDPSLSPAEKLALAYSGWLLGSSNAQTSLEAAIAVWDARFILSQYLREPNPQQRRDLLAELQALESVGPEQVEQIIPRLPLPKSAQAAQPGAVHRIEVPTSQAEMPISYSVLLPQEYNPNHQYPLLVTLRPAELSSDQQVRWWGITRSLTSGAEMAGQSQRHGYIVIAPDYMNEKESKYRYDAASHYVVLESIRDARMRFNVDSDRVFLSGHGMGGDAAFDIGMSHPHLFAGVLPVVGMIDKYCTSYWKNAEHVAWYIVGGEYDRDSLEQNDYIITQMMRLGYDVMYTEFIGRGYESYYSEIHRMFEWMSLHRRAPSPKLVEAKILRPTDNRFYWVYAAGFPPNVSSVPLPDVPNGRRVIPMNLEARVTAANVLNIRSGADRHTLWLAPDIVDFDEKLLVRIKGLQRFNDYLRPEIEPMLEDLRDRGDRQRLYSVRLDFD